MLSFFWKALHVFLTSVMKEREKAHNALQKKMKLILNIFLLHVVFDCFMTDVYSTTQSFSNLLVTPSCKFKCHTYNFLDTLIYF